MGRKQTPSENGPRSKPKPCTCKAYRWPHRAGGGLCRWPLPPESTHPTSPGTNRPSRLRRRRAALGIMRYYGLHPIRDAALLDRVLPLLRADWRLSLDEAIALADARDRRSVARYST